MRQTWLLYGGWVALVGVIGAAWGFVRGLSYLPTLWAAPLEGSLLFAGPAAVAGLPVVGLTLLALSMIRRLRARPGSESASGVGQPSG